MQSKPELKKRKIGKNKLKQDEFHKAISHQKRPTSDKKRLRDMKRLAEHLQKNVNSKGSRNPD